MPRPVPETYKTHQKQSIFPRLHCVPPKNLQRLPAQYRHSCHHTHMLENLHIYPLFMVYWYQIDAHAPLSAHIGQVNASVLEWRTTNETNTFYFYLPVYNMAFVYAVCESFHYAYTP